MAKAIVTTPPAPLQASPARTTLLLGGTLLALAAAVLLSLTVGSKPTTVAQVWAAVTGTADPYTTTVVASRYPRTILGILAGAALAAAGLLLQGITRNPLADPGLLGVNAGAMAAVVTAIALLGPTPPRQQSGGRFPAPCSPASSPTSSAAGKAPAAPSASSSLEL